MSTLSQPGEGVSLRLRLGETLVARGLVTEDQVNEALVEQQRTGERLGRVLAAAGAITELQLVAVLADHFRIGFVDLDEYPIDTTAARHIRESFSRRYLAIGIGWDDGVLLVAMANPADVFALDDIRTLAGAEVRPFISEAAQVARAISRIWKDGSAEHALDQARQEADTATVATRARAGERQEPLVDGAPVVRFVTELISRAANEGASDVHLEPTGDKLRVRFRVDGMLRDVMTVPRNLQANVVSRIKVMSEIDIADRRAPQDGRFTLQVDGRDLDLRVVSFPTTNGEAVVLRLLDKSGGGHAISDLGFRPETLERYESAYRKPSGAILVTGPTGSGKSTTLYATLEEVNEPHRNIISVEDPVEYAVDGVKQVQVNPRAGLTFASVLRSLLRADPDVVMVGEIRDPETARIAIEAALTGHLVLSSLHTKTAAAAPARLVDMGVEPFLVTSAVECVVAQRLARRLCDRCKQPFDPADADLVRDGWRPDILGDEPHRFHRPVGCRWCGETGYRGRFAIHEVLLLSEEIARLVMDRCTAGEVEGLAVEQGMVTMREDGLIKAAQGLTSLEELARIVT